MTFNAREISENLGKMIWNAFKEELPIVPEIEKALQEAYLTGRREQAEESLKILDEANILGVTASGGGFIDTSTFLYLRFREAAKKIGSKEKK